MEEIKYMCAQVTFKCGCTQKVPISGHPIECNDLIRLYESMLCKECTRKALIQTSIEMSQKRGFPPLNGSDDQITKGMIERECLAIHNEDIDDIIEMIDKLPNYEKDKIKMRSDMTLLKEKFDVDFKNTSATYWIEKGQLNIDEETSLLNIPYQRLLMFVDGYRIEREYKKGG